MADAGERLCCRRVPPVGRGDAEGVARVRWPKEKAGSGDDGKAGQQRQQQRRKELEVLITKQLVAAIELLEASMPYAQKSSRLVEVWRNRSVPNKAR